MVSVVICTYNPSIKVLTRVLNSLKHQTLDAKKWELILVDNNSVNPVSSQIDLSWKVNSSLLLEMTPGLSFARLKGVLAAQNNLIVFVDDDNILNKSYLEIADSFFCAHPQVGCFGGKSIPLYETSPPSWLSETGINLGCQDFGDQLYISTITKTKQTQYPDKAPIGTGMVVSKVAFLKYVNDVQSNPERLKLGRVGNQLTSGEDNDIVLTIVKHGYELAYVPDLVISHYIPQKRYTKSYLEKMAFDSNRSWIKVLDIHSINPWKPIPKYTLKLRQLRAWFSHKAWKGEAAFIKWKGACGLFQGLSEID